MAAAKLRRPISCSNVAAATRPSRDLGDSSESPGRRMSRPGVQGNDVTGDVAGSSSVIRLLSPEGPGSCGSSNASGWSGSNGITNRRIRLPLVSQVMAVDAGPMPHLFQQLLAQKPPYLWRLDIPPHPLPYFQFLLSVVQARRILTRSVL